MINWISNNKIAAALIFFVTALITISIYVQTLPNPEPIVEPEPTAVPFEFENTATPETSEETETEPEAIDEPTIDITSPTFNTLTEAIEALTVAEENNTDYDRDKFRHWVNADRDEKGCDTRDDVLIAEAQTPPDIVDSKCQIFGGEWYSKYDNIVLNNSSDLDIDHMVPLKEAWESGAWAWNNKTREAFANDLGLEYSLIAVSASSNRSKSDRDPPNWMPTNTAYKCDYLYEWVSVKTRWSLTVDEVERTFLLTETEKCIQNGYNPREVDVPIAEIVLAD